eukprot:gene6124-10133_t
MDEFDESAIKKKSKTKKKKKEDEELTLEGLEASLNKKKNKKKTEEEEGFTFTPSSGVKTDEEKKKKKKKEKKEEDESFTFTPDSSVKSSKMEEKKKKKKEKKIEEEEEGFSFKPSKIEEKKQDIPEEDDLSNLKITEKKKKKKKIEEGEEKMNLEEEIVQEEEEVKKKKKKKHVEEIIVETSEEEEEEEFEEIEFLFEPPEKPEVKSVKYDESVEKLFPKKDWVFICNRLWDDTQRFFQIEYLHEALEIKSAPNSPEMVNKNNISQTSFSSDKSLGTISPRNLNDDLSEKNLSSPRNFTEGGGSSDGSEKKKKKSKIISAGVGKDFFDLERKHHKDKKKILRKGELVKKSAITGIWTKKFFVLRADKLMFFSSEKIWKSGVKSEGSIFLEGAAIEENTTNHKLKEKRPYCFVIYSRGISYYLECNSESSMREWIELLIQCSSMRFS